MVDDQTFGVRFTRGEPRLAKWYHDQRPAIIATAWFWLAFLVLAGITLVTGWASRPVTLVLQWPLSFGAGVLAAYLHQKEYPGQTGAVRMGILAGCYLPLSVAAVMMMLAILAAFVSFGTTLFLTIPYFVTLPLEIGACTIFGALGAWLYTRLARIH